MTSYSLTRPRVSPLGGAACSIGRVRLRVESVGSRGWRESYRWTVRIGRREWSEEDMTAGFGIAGDTDRDRDLHMMGALVSFLSSCVESRRYGARTGRKGEQADLFPADMMDAIEGLGIGSDDLYLPEGGE